MTKAYAQSGRDARRGALLVGCDVGGTFTDFVVLDPVKGAIHVEKVLTTPGNPTEGILQGLEQLSRGNGLVLRNADRLVHGTTLATNAIVARSGARTALLHTEGFRDILEQRRGQRYRRYNLFQQFPDPLVERPLRQPIAERIDGTGKVRKPLDAAQALETIRSLVETGVESFAIALLNAYQNPSHERGLRDLIASVDPQIPVSLSSDVLPRMGEYERTSTTVINAYVRPIIERYLANIQDEIARSGFGGTFVVMNSSGGLMPVELAAALPVHIVESGPAGGVVCAAFYGRLLGHDTLISFDMGGSTAKGCLVSEGRFSTNSDHEVVREDRFSKGSGLPLAVPVADLIEVGAGGGSLARVNRLGLVQVGPESAGADPGPACYQLGGTSPTVTDADVALGYLDPLNFLGGEMKLDPKAAERSIETEVARPRGIATIDAAWAIHDIANENMAAALKTYLDERGSSPASLPMVAFGGAGPVHAYGVACKLGIKTVIVPPAAGVFSALGLLLAAPSFEVSRTFRRRLSQLDPQELLAAYEELRVKAIAAIRPLGPSATPTVRALAEMRYVGQGFEIVVDVPELRATRLTGKELRALFDTAYEAKYRRTSPDSDAETMTLRLIASFPPFEASPTVKRTAEKDQKAQGRSIYFGPKFGHIASTVRQRGSLAAGEIVPGPAVIEEKESTLVVGPNASVSAGTHGELVMTIGSAADR